MLKFMSISVVLCFCIRRVRSVNWITAVCYTKLNASISSTLDLVIRYWSAQTPQHDWMLEGWFTLGLRKAEQSLKTGLFYYDEISTPCSARACASPAQPKYFYAQEGTAQESSARISAWAGTVLRYFVGIIQEGGVFMRLHNVSGRKSSSNGLYRYWNDRTCVLRELHLDYCSFKNNSWVQ